MSKANILRQHIMDNLTPEGFRIAGWREVANAHDLDYNYLISLVGRMKRQGIIKESEAEQLKRFKQAQRALRRVSTPPEPSDTTPSPAADPEASVDVLDGITSLPSGMPREERIRKLSAIARGGSELAQLKAMDALEQMERAAGSSYGPPPPSSRDDTVKLVSELLKSINPEWVREAINVYEQAQTAENPDESSESPDSTGDLGGPAA